MQIRDLAPADLDQVLALNNANSPAVGLLDADRLDALVAWSSIALVADPGDATVAGFCLVLGPGRAYGSVNYRWFAERYDDFVYLDRVAVSEQHRGAGIGAALYAEVEQRAGAPWLTLEVNLRPRNDGSLRFHQRLGFGEVGQQETDYGFLVSMLAKPLTVVSSPE